MGRIILSVSVQKGVYAVIILKDGQLINKEVHKVTVGDNIYTQLLNVLVVGFRMLRQEVEKDLSVSEVVIELNNSIIIKWFSRGMSKEDYDDAFMEAVQELNNIPILYTFTYNSKPKASFYAKEENIEKPKLTGLEDFL